MIKLKKGFAALEKDKRFEIGGKHYKKFPLDTIMIFSPMNIYFITGFMPIMALMIFPS